MANEYGSNTINNINNQRNSLPFQEPIGSSNTGISPVTLVNGTIGGGFARMDETPQFATGTIGRASAVSPTGRTAYYAVSAAGVTVPTGATGCTVGGLPTGAVITSSTGGTYNSPNRLASGQYGWVYAT